MLDVSRVDFICSEDLFISKRGNFATFVTVGIEEVLNPSLSSKKIVLLIS